MAFRCDLHVHSTWSDGSFSPSELVEEAQRQRVSAFALTDHDAVGGIGEALDAGRRAGVEVLPGIEISVSEDDGRRQLHLLGIGVDPEAPGIVELVTRSRDEREQRGREIAARLAVVGVELDFEQLLAEAGGGAIGRPHVARALVRSGVCTDAEDAFERYLRRGKPAYVSRGGIGAREAIALIHAAGGVSSLAHPRLSVGADGPGGLEAFVGRLASLGLDGLELEHPSHSQRLRRRLRGFAQKYDLVCTGGSDFHGESRPDVALGRGRGGNVSVGRAAYDAVRERIARLRAGAPPTTPGANASPGGAHAS